VEAIRSGAPAPASDAPIVYPVMTDDDAPAMRVPAVGLVTNTRREGGGYFWKREVFPRKRDTPIQDLPATVGLYGPMREMTI